MKYLPYYRIIEKKGPVSFVNKSQWDGSKTKAYDEDIRLANIDDWQISKDANNRLLRDAAYVISPQPSDSETESDSDPEKKNVPLSKLAKKYRQERETSEDEEDIPLMDLRKCLRHREMRQTQNEETKVKDMECNVELSSDNISPLPLVESVILTMKWMWMKFIHPNTSWKGNTGDSETSEKETKEVSR